jgi:hypothetical protein
MSSIRPGHVNATDFPELEVPSAARDQHEPSFEDPGGAPLPLAGGRWRRTCSSTFENLD